MQYIQPVLVTQGYKWSSFKDTQISLEMVAISKIVTSSSPGDQGGFFPTPTIMKLVLSRTLWVQILRHPKPCTHLLWCYLECRIRKLCSVQDQLPELMLMAPRLFPDCVFPDRQFPDSVFPTLQLSPLASFQTLHFPDLNFPDYSNFPDYKFGCPPVTHCMAFCSVISQRLYGKCPILHRNLSFRTLLKHVQF